MDGYTIQWRVDIAHAQRIEYVVAVVGDDQVCTKIDVQPGDVLIVYRSKLTEQQEQQS